MREKGRFESEYEQSEIDALKAAGDEGLWNVLPYDPNADEATQQINSNNRTRLLAIFRRMAEIAGWVAPEPPEG